jgi:RNA polymerase sigma-70 factor, ECF subfamily
MACILRSKSQAAGMLVRGIGRTRACGVTNLANAPTGDRMTTATAPARFGPGSWAAAAQFVRPLKPGLTARPPAVPFRGLMAATDLMPLDSTAAQAATLAPATTTPTSAAQDAFEATVRPLWLAAQAGDEAAYRSALQALAKRLRAYLRRRMQRLPDDVEDLVQETLLALHLQRGTWDESVPVSAWALAIARHKLVDLWRRRGRREDLHLHLDDVDAGGLAAELSIDAAEGAVHHDLEGLLANLPEAQSRAIVLTKLEGLSVAEAAARTGASESAIKVQVHRGLKKLAELVGRG